MKRFRFLLIGVAAALLLALTAIGVAFNSRFQTWMVRRTLAKQPGIQATVGRVSAGLHRVHLEQLRLATAGATVTVPSVDIDLPVLSAAGGKLQIAKLVAVGWTVDLTAAKTAQPAAAGGSQAAAGLPGFLNQLNLPVDLSIAALELDGEIIVAGAEGQPPVRARVSIAGGGLSAGSDGKFTFSANTALAPGAVVNSMLAKGDLNISMTTPRTFSSVSATLVLEARGPQLPQNARLSVVASASRANSGETYAIAVESAGRPLLSAQASIPASGLAGKWMLDLTDADIAPFSLGRALPTFTAKGAGRFAADPKFKSPSASGHLEGVAEKLAALRPELATWGGLRFSVDFDVSQEGDTWKVAALSADVASAQPVLSVRAVQSFELNTKSRAVKVSDASKDLMTLDLKGVPVAWATPFVGGRVVSGDVLRGSFVLASRDGGFAARSTAPLTAGNLSLDQGGRALVRAMDVSLGIAADYTPLGWQIQLTDMNTRSNGVTLLSVSARAGQLGKDQPLKIQGTWSANLPGLLAQPGAAGIASLTAGRASGDLMASIGSKTEYRLKLALADLAVDPKTSTEVLPTLLADFGVDIEAGGRISVSAPIAIERDGRKSDISLSGTVTRSPTSTTIDARASSEFFAAEDGQAFAAILAPAEQGPRTPAPAAPAGRDPAPFWAGLGGQLTFDLKKVGYRQQLELTDVAGTVRIDQGALRFESFRANAGEGSNLKAGGGLTFSARAADAYSLDAEVAVENLDSGPLFRAMDPSQQPTVEGRFNVASRLAGAAPNFGMLMGRVRGEFELTSKGGYFRGLKADMSDKLQAGQSIAAAGLSALGLSDIGNRTKAVVEIARRCETIPFAQLSVKAARDEKLNLVLKDFSLIGPEHRIVGTGEIRHVDGLPFVAQPLDLRLQLATRGEIAELLKKASLLDGKQDSLGYSGFIAPIKVGGTLDKPDNSEFKATLLKVAAANLLERLIK